MSAKKKLSIVEIEWVDSAFHRGWSGRDTKEREMSVSKCRTVGYLVKRDSDAIHVALSVDEALDSLADGMSIPTVAIKRVRTIK